MYSIVKKAVALALVALAPLGHAQMATTATVFLKGEPGSWVSGAVGAPQATWVHGIDGIFQGNVNFSQGISIRYQGNN
jgi:hypothetical protein